MKKRIVVKIGSSSLTNEQGELDLQKFNDHIEAIVMLRQKGHEVVLVSSGAVAAGFKGLGYPARPTTLKGKQAAAAVGQGILMKSYYDTFCEYKIQPAQILLTRTDFSNKTSYKNAYSTLTELLERGILPIINENDTVSIEELTFGDNDMLSALVSGLIHADSLIILTDINGIYDKNPKEHPTAIRLDYLEKIDDGLLKVTEGTGSKIGTGGMKSKLLAAKTALSLGVPIFIGLGKGPIKLLNIINGTGDGTYIGRQLIESLSTKRQWIALHSPVAGKLFVDEGAEEALLFYGRSLLPAGVYDIEGEFQKGDVVEVYNSTSLLGKGEVTCSSEDLKLVIHNRQRTKQKQVELIHRDKWVRV